MNMEGFREQTDSCQSGGGWGLGERGEGIKQRKKERLRDTDNSMVIARGKGGGVGGGGRGDKEGINDDERRLSWGGEHTVQSTDDVL